MEKLTRSNDERVKSALTRDREGFDQWIGWAKLQRKEGQIDKLLMSKITLNERKKKEKNYQLRFEVC